VSQQSAYPVVYRIDGDDKIVFVNDAWRTFAADNGAPALADGVVGTSLWDAIGGAETRHVWQLLLRRARDGADVVVPYRCDSAAERRHMRMSLRRLPGGDVEFVSETVESDRRDPVERYELLRACSWCNRFDLGGWVDPEEAADQAGLLEAEPAPITHGICPDCQATVMRALEARRSADAC
jgi:hypothetical protein